MHSKLRWLFAALLFASLVLPLTLVAQSSGPPRPEERTQLPIAPPVDRTTDAPRAPEILDVCGTDAITGFELPDRARPYARDAATFSLQVRDEVIPYRLMSVGVLPGESVEIEAILGTPASSFNACSLAGELVRLDDDEWTWWAPETPGVYSVFVTDGTTASTVKLQMLVLQPYESEDVFEGYRLGRYERVPLRGDPKYETPEGFLRVTPDMLDLWLSPHFQLRQFLCKQTSDYPKFAIVDPRLLLKLEWLLERVNAEGIPANTFAVLSGFRTPHYNHAIGNKTRYSRHLYGDAADIYIDRDGDGRMDDLTGDGKVTRADAERLASIVEASFGEIWYEPFVGGLGLYGPKPHRGPFVHVDTRGFRARW